MGLPGRLWARLFGDGEPDPGQEAEGWSAPTESAGGEEARADDESADQPAAEGAPAGERQPPAGELTADEPAATDLAGLEPISDDLALAELAEGTLPEPPSDEAVAARQERAAGWLLDDEGLRGDLTDDEYQPLLDWALSASDRIAAETAGLDDAQALAALEAGVSAVKSAVRLAGEAVAAWAESDHDRARAALRDLAGQADWLTAAGLDGPQLSSGLRALADGLADRPDPTAADLAVEIALALAGSPASGPSVEAS